MRKARVYRRATNWLLRRMGFTPRWLLIGCRREGVCMDSQALYRWLGGGDGLSPASAERVYRIARHGAMVHADELADQSEGPERAEREWD